MRGKQARYPGRGGDPERPQLAPRLLGGQVIAKALCGASWAPEGGLSYFNPYGRRTAAVWAEFCAALEAAAPTLDEDAAVQGARATFEALRTAVAEPMDAAA